MMPMGLPAAKPDAMAAPAAAPVDASEQRRRQMLMALLQGGGGGGMAGGGMAGIAPALGGLAQAVSERWLTPAQGGPKG